MTTASPFGEVFLIILHHDFHRKVFVAQRAGADAHGIEAHAPEGFCYDKRLVGGDDNIAWRAAQIFLGVIRLVEEDAEVAAEREGVCLALVVGGDFELRLLGCSRTLLQRLKRMRHDGRRRGRLTQRKCRGARSEQEAQPCGQYAYTVGFCFSSNARHAELMQKRLPVFVGPSSNMWPRCEPQLAHVASTRLIPSDVSSW